MARRFPRSASRTHFADGAAREQPRASNAVTQLQPHSPRDVPGREPPRYCVKRDGGQGRVPAVYGFVRQCGQGGESCFCLATVSPWSARCHGSAGALGSPVSPGNTLARVEKPRRVERALDLSHRVDVAGSTGELHKRPPTLTNAMFGADAAAVGSGQVEDEPVDLPSSGAGPST